MSTFSNTGVGDSATGFQKGIPRKRGWRRGWIWTWVAAIGRQPPGAEAGLPTLGTAGAWVLTDGPQTGRDDAPSEARKPRGRGGRKVPRSPSAPLPSQKEAMTASRAPYEEGRPPPGRCRVPAWSRGVWELQRVRGEAEFRSPTGPTTGSGWPARGARGEAAGRGGRAASRGSRPTEGRPPPTRKSGPERGRTWEGAERGGVGTQRPVAHPRHQLQAQDLLQEPCRRPAAAAPLAFHPAAIHRRGLRESARAAAEGERPRCRRGACSRTARSAPHTSAAAASPSAAALFLLPQRPCQVTAPSSNHRALPTAGAGRASFPPPLTLRTALRDLASYGLRPLLEKSLQLRWGTVGSVLFYSAT